MALTTTHTLIQISEKRAFALQPSKSNIFLQLASNTAQDILLEDLKDVEGRTPTFLNFNAIGGDFYVVWNGTGASVPSANELDGTSGEFNPSLRNVSGLNGFSIVSSTATKVAIGLFIGQ